MHQKKVKGQGYISFLSSDTKCTTADQKLRPRQIHACAVMIFSSRLNMAKNAYVGSSKIMLFFQSSVALKPLG